MTSTTYNVPGISCNHCKQSIETAVKPLTGVGAVDVDIDAKTVTVTGGDPSAVQAAITDAGYAIV